MNKEKKPMDEVKKAKLIYSGELAAISAIFIFLGIMEIALIMGTRDIFFIAFQYGGLVGSAYFIFDLIWALTSKKKRAKSSLFDKIGVIPACIYTIVFCILMLTNVINNQITKRIFLGYLILYFGILFAAEAIYHYFYIHPSTLLEIEKAHKEAEEKKLAQN